jgi:hypothetical protein
MMETSPSRLLYPMLKFEPVSKNGSDEGQQRDEACGVVCPIESRRRKTAVSR